MTTDADEYLERLETWLDRLEREVADGETVDLSGLDQAVEAACNAVTAAPAESAAHYRSRLSNFLTRIEDLQSRLQAQYEGIQAELQTHGRRSQASRAYAQWMPNKPAKD